MNKQYDKKDIEFASQLNKNDVIDIFYYGNIIKENCLILETIQDHYFYKGLIIYLNCSSRETIDLENQDGLWIKKVIT